MASRLSLYGGAYRCTHARVNEDWRLQDRYQASSLLLTCSAVDDSSSIGLHKELDRMSSAGMKLGDLSESRTVNVLLRLGADVAARTRDTLRDQSVRHRIGRPGENPSPGSG